MYFVESVTNRFLEPDLHLDVTKFIIRAAISIAADPPDPFGVFKDDPENQSADSDLGEQIRMTQRDVLRRRIPAASAINSPGPLFLADVDRYRLLSMRPKLPIPGPIRDRGNSFSRV